MSTKAEILNNFKRHIQEQYDMPNMDILGIEFSDPLKHFIEMSKLVGGIALELDMDSTVDTLIQSLYPQAKTIASNLNYITLANVNPDEVDDPHKLNGIDLAVVEGEMGVAENGCVWLPQNVRQKVIYFIAEYLVIVLDKKKIVHTMHQAYKNLSFTNEGFGVFISGPSKTADIEQALVVGAHGAKGVTVILK